MKRLADKTKPPKGDFFFCFKELIFSSLSLQCDFTSGAWFFEQLLSTLIDFGPLFFDIFGHMTFGIKFSKMFTFYNIKKLFGKEDIKPAKIGFFWKSLKRVAQYKYSGILKNKSATADHYPRAVGPSIGKDSTTTKSLVDSATLRGSRV